jgi:hypothetical protein
MVNAIAIMILIAVVTRIYKIYKNGGVTDIGIEVYEVGSHLIASFILFGIFMTIASI